MRRSKAMRSYLRCSWMRAALALINQHDVSGFLLFEEKQRSKKKISSHIRDGTLCGELTIGTAARRKTPTR